MNQRFYVTGRGVCRFIFFCTMRLHLLRPEVPLRPGGYVLALTHVGHLDPVCSSVLIDRPIRWMARKEFFANRFAAWLLRRVGAFSVNRQGIPVSAIRRAIEHVKRGEVVGICPEGGRAWGADACFRGGKIKQGVCSVAIRSGVPVVPCIMLGTHELHRVGPWLPARRGKLWVAYGTPLEPPRTKSTRATREQLRGQLSDAYVKLYQELCSEFGVQDTGVP